MLTAISRYGARVLPDTEQIAAASRARGEYIQGPQIAEFERAFERRAGRGTGVTVAYGRIAFYYMLKALELPPGAEIIVPSLTFWVMPELARVAGLTVVFADVDPKTFNLDPASVIPVGMGGLRDLLQRYIDVGFSKFVVRPAETPAHWPEALEELANGALQLQT